MDATSAGAGRFDEHVAARGGPDRTADAAHGPGTDDLAAARRRVRARRRRLTLRRATVATCLAAAGVLTASMLFSGEPRTGDRAVGPPPDPGRAAGASGPVAVQRADLLDGGPALSVGVTATTADSVCATELTATARESATEIEISVHATSRRAGTACPREPRRVLLPLDRAWNDRALVDKLTGNPVPLGGPYPGGHHPGDPPIPFERIVLLDDGRGLELRFHGVPEDAGPCGARYHGTVRESSRRVDVRVHTEPADTSRAGSVACPDIAGRRAVTVRLSQALGDRDLYDASGRRLRPASR